MTCGDPCSPTPSRFPHETQQNRQIAEASTTADSAMDSVVRLRRENDVLRTQVARQQLILQTLLDWHINQGHFDRGAFGILMARADLADGVEDGALGPDRALAAPSCGDCGRPVNPKRKACVFCGAKVTASASAKPPARTVSCRKCGESVPESRTYFSGNGLVCEFCFS